LAAVLGKLSGLRPHWSSHKAVETTQAMQIKYLVMNDNCVDVDVLALTLLSNEMDLAERGVNR
jgi:hypothetical protein